MRAARLAAQEIRPPGWWHKLLFALVFTQLGLMSLVWNLVAPLFSLVLPRQVGGRVGCAAISFLYRCAWASAQAFGLMRIDASSLDVLRDEPGGLVIAANHPSMLDALIVVAHLPRGVCIMKAELLRNIFLGGGARLARYIRNDSGRGMVRDAVASLRAGNQLVFFPEGTRTVKAPVNAFQPGVTFVAHLAGVPIQTVLIEIDSKYLAKGWPLLRAPPVPVVLRVRLGERFMPGADHRASLRQLESYFARELGA
ncbi:MAG: lysophospholipid acyltransferase family protein [Caldimonas sp.]